MSSQATAVTRSPTTGGSSDTSCARDGCGDGPHRRLDGRRSRRTQRAVGGLLRRPGAPAPCPQGDPRTVAPHGHRRRDAATCLRRRHAAPLARRLDWTGPPGARVARGHVRRLRHRGADPDLDRRIVEFVASLPQRRYPVGVANKALIREALPGCPPRHGRRPDREGDGNEHIDRVVVPRDRPSQRFPTCQTGQPVHRSDRYRDEVARFHADDADAAGDLWPAWSVCSPRRVP